MNTNTTTKPAKIGRPLTGDAPMTSTERARRTRERKQASGIKGFLLQLQGSHLAYVERLAKDNQVSTSTVMCGLLKPALDRHVEVMQHCERMKENGATDEQVVQFMRTYRMPDLPPMPEKNEQ